MKTVINIQQRQEEMETDFLQCLRNREIPSRFSYWGKAESDGWLKVCNSKHYDVYRDCTEMVKKNAAALSEVVHEDGTKNYNFISVGIGDGLKDAYLIKALMKMEKSLNYFPIDISLDMMNEGMKNIDADNLAMVAFIADFKDFSEISDRIRQGYSQSHFISILGNTLGNFGQVEILNNIRRGMTINDYLLIEVTLKKGRGSKTRGEDLTEIIENYNNDDYKDFVFCPLTKAGFERSDGIIEVEYGPNQFYPKLYSIELWFRLIKDKVVEYHGEEIVFKKDERIRLYVSHKYTYENISELLDGNGFEVPDFKVVTDNYALILSKLKK